MSGMSRGVAAGFGPVRVGVYEDQDEIRTAAQRPKGRDCVCV
jgi:hypothetical protein